MISFVSGYYGFLGNQMFQYAATRAQALRLRTLCSFPHNRPDLHEVFDQLPDNPPGLLVRGRFTETQFHYDCRIECIEDYTELSGYFQSERYFAAHADQIRTDFVFASHVVFDHPCVVSVHVRRGDYLSFPEHHPPLSMDYYHRAMECFPGARFMVFTDDPGWCLLNFPRESCTIRTGHTAAEDMALMTDCAHHIIANSSFSWWGAWLGRNPDKRVIAPRRWFGPAKATWDTSDLLPPSWETL